MSYIKFLSFQSTHLYGGRSPHPLLLVGDVADVARADIRDRGPNAAHPVDRPDVGSEVLEAAIVLPMLIVLAFCLIQVCLIAYEGTAMSAAIESAAMKSDFSAAIASGNVNQAVKDELASNTPGIVKDNITVTNSKVSYSDRSDEATVTDTGSTGITTISKSSTTALLESTVDYKIPTLISVGSFDGIKMSKTIKVEVPVSEKMEVSR